MVRKFLKKEIESLMDGAALGHHITEIVFFSSSFVSSQLIATMIINVTIVIFITITMKRRAWWSQSFQRSCLRKGHGEIIGVSGFPRFIHRRWLSGGEITSVRGTRREGRDDLRQGVGRIPSMKFKSTALSYIVPFCPPNYFIHKNFIILR